MSSTHHEHLNRRSGSNRQPMCPPVRLPALRCGIAKYLLSSSFFYGTYSGKIGHGCLRSTGQCGRKKMVIWLWLRTNVLSELIGLFYFLISRLGYSKTGFCNVVSASPYRNIAPVLEDLRQADKMVILDHPMFATNTRQTVGVLLFRIKSYQKLNKTATNQPPSSI